MAKNTIDAITIDVYFDFLCPFAYKAVVWLNQVKEIMGDRLSINWKYFSLEQVNNQNGPDWKIWEQPEEYFSRGLSAFRAAEAARRQGESAFDSFRDALYRATHEEGRDMTDIDVLVDIAGDAGLNTEHFRETLGDRSILKQLADDHTYAVDTLRVFGTPTLVFPGNNAVFLKMSAVPPSGEESVTFFNELKNLAENHSNILEIKRP